MRKVGPNYLELAVAGGSCEALQTRRHHWSYTLEASTMHDVVMRWTF